MEKALKTRYHDAMSILQPQGKELDLLIVVLPDNNGSLYGMSTEILCLLFISLSVLLYFLLYFL